MSAFGTGSIPDRATAENRLREIERRQRDARGEDAIFDAARRLILRSPDGHYWQVSVSNAGVLATTDLGTTAP